MPPLERIRLVVGDIVDQEADAIVNAANTTLLGGGGVDRAIHRAAGEELLAECRTLGGCPTGSARITKGYRLKARWIIHAVGPVWGARPSDAEKLASAYRESMRLAARHEIRTIAFPSISTGAYRYPLAEAASIALRTVAAELEAPASRIELVTFVLWDERTHRAYEEALADLRSSGLGQGTTGPLPRLPTG
jgi:O-acetyl-ADP-ribose deacetylase (regulator of RNase III)